MKTFSTLLLTLISLLGYSQNQLAIPPTMEGSAFDLTLQNGEVSFFSGHQTATMGVNGPILGPTLIMKRGENVDIKVKNDLGQATTIHWHGMQVSSENDGGPHIIIEPGESWNPKFEVINRASTCWYHPHLDTHTDEHVSKGIAGFIIVQDDEESSFDLPRIYGIDDIPLAIQTKSFNSDFQIEWDVNTDDVLLVNGTMDAFINVPAQVIRLRLLDGTSQRVLNIGMENNQKIYQIATDGGLLDKPVELTRLPLAPGQRGEILLDFTGMEGKTVHLMSYASELGNSVYGSADVRPNLSNYNPNPLNGKNFNILKFIIGAPNGAGSTTIPVQLAGDTPPNISDVDQNRSLLFRAVSPGMNQLNGDFYINGVSFDKDIINFTIDLNNTEIWTITNRTPIAHPFHLHDVGYYILDINGVPPPAHAKGKIDTYLVPAHNGSMRIITKFDRFSNDAIPYMYHCHMLKHEDGGMMGSFVVVDKTAVVDIDNSGAVNIFPNPNHLNYITLSLNDDSEYIKAYAIIDESGRILSYHMVDEHEWDHQFSIPTYDYASGIYMVKIYTQERIYEKKISIIK